MKDGFLQWIRNKVSIFGKEVFEKKMSKMIGYSFFIT